MNICVTSYWRANEYQWNPQRTSVNSFTWTCKSTTQYLESDPITGEPKKEKPVLQQSGEIVAVDDRFYL